MIIHADINSFYASAEQLFRPDLYGKPVIVLSNNDGVIIALNRHAKARGFKRGDVYFHVRDRAEREGVAVFSSNYTLYADLSRRVNDLYMEFAGGDIEPYSIDESFLFFPDLNEKALTEIATELRRKVWREIGLPICVGTGPTKTLAKLYNKHAKAHGGVYICTKENVDKELAETDCATIWGIGQAGAHKLTRAGITNALQLKNADPLAIKRLLTITGYAVVQELNGRPYKDKLVKYKRDIITSSRMFGSRIRTLEELQCATATYTQLAEERLFSQESLARLVTLYLTTGMPYDDNESTQQTYSNSCTAVLPYHTGNIMLLNHAAQEALTAVFRPGYGYKSLMVTLSDLTDSTGTQIDLFDDTRRLEKEAALMQSYHQVNTRYGRGTLVLASSGSKTGWQMKRHHLSPCYTTRLVDSIRL